MREVLFVFWGIMTGLTAVAGAIGCGMLVSAHVPVLVLASAIAGTFVSVMCGVTVMFIIDNVGRK